MERKPVTLEPELELLCGDLDDETSELVARRWIRWAKQLLLRADINRARADQAIIRKSRRRARWIGF